MTALPRRRLLYLSGAALVGLTGCQFGDPRIQGGPTAPPIEPSPTPTPNQTGIRTALTHELDLATLSTQLAEASETLRLPPGPAATAGWMAAAHDLHVTALLGRRPAQRPSSTPTPERGWTPTPRPTTTATLPTADRAQAMGELTGHLDRAVADHRSAALSTTGTMALLFGSLAGYAKGAGVALAADPLRPAPPTQPVIPLEVWSDMEAAQHVLRQVHALVYGYQVALPWFRRQEADHAFTTMLARRELRDRLAALLRDRGVAAPAADAAYELPVSPTDRATAAELLWRMDTAFAPFAGAWLAAATDPGVREFALATLVDTVTLAVGWGGPLVVWPGWPT